MAKPVTLSVDASTAEAVPAAAGFSADRLLRVTEMLRRDVGAGAAPAVIPGAVAMIVRNGELAYSEAFGYAEEKALRPMQRNSVFRIASMTKPLTATAALILMERGELVLGDPVWHYLPQLKSLQVGVESLDAASGERRLALEPCRRPMTVQDLMRHTAGFTYGQFGNSLVQREYRSANLMDDQQTNAEMLEKLARLPLAYQPGTTFEYGMSTDVLGHVVEKIAGRPLDSLFAEWITEPLGMVDTGFSATAEHLERLAEPRRDPASGTRPAVPPWNAARPAKWFSGGGGLLSTAADYVRFGQMLLNGGELAGVRVLARKTVELMTRNHLPPALNFGTFTPELGIAAPLPQLGLGYGLGLGVRMSPGLVSVPGSVGDFYWGGALGPYFWVDPAEQLIVVFMLQELNVQRRTRYRALLRNLVYGALE